MKSHSYLFTILIVGVLVISGCIVESENKKISAVIVPHHTIVAAQRGQTLQKVAAHIPQPKTIILLSPNHYELGGGNIQTTRMKWNLAEEKIVPHLSVIDRLIQNGGVRDETPSFRTEHGIYLLLPDIARFFPNATIVPIIFKLHTSRAEIEKVKSVLIKECFECLLITSVDFSHYQGAELAELHDVLTRRALAELETDLILKKSETDNPPALALTTLWAQDHGTPHFFEDAHTNSGLMTGDMTIQTTTHFFAWYQEGQKLEVEGNITFLFGPEKLSNAKMEEIVERRYWGTDTVLSFKSTNAEFTHNNVSIAVMQRDSFVEEKEFLNQLRNNARLGKGIIVIAPSKTNRAVLTSWQKNGAALIITKNTEEECAKIKADHVYCLSDTENPLWIAGTVTQNGLAEFIVP